MTRYFIFGRSYRRGDDYVRCDRRSSAIIAPGVGETRAEEELSLGRCLALARRGVMREVTAGQVGERRMMANAFGEVADRLRSFQVKAAPHFYERRFHHGRERRN
jgi:hypothetical protein